MLVVDKIFVNLLKGERVCVCCIFGDFVYFFIVEFYYIVLEGYDRFYVKD